MTGCRSGCPKIHSKLPTYNPVPSLFFENFPFLSFFFFFFLSLPPLPFSPASPPPPPAGLVLTVLSTQALVSWRFSCLLLPNAGITDVCSTLDSIFCFPDTRNVLLPHVQRQSKAHENCDSWRCQWSDSRGTWETTCLLGIVLISLFEVRRHWWRLCLAWTVYVEGRGHALSALCFLIVDVMRAGEASSGCL